MDPSRQRLIDRARELNTSDLPVAELQERIREVCSEYLIEAKVDVDRLLRHEEWSVRWNALDIVSWGLGATDGIDRSLEILMRDPDEEVRAGATLALYESARGTPKEAQVMETFMKAADADESDYVRESAQRWLHKLEDERRMNATISKAVAIFRQSPTASDEEIYRSIVSAGVEGSTSARLVELLPMAYCRLILAGSGTGFSDRFQRKLGDGNLSPERALATEPLWEEARSFAIAEQRSGVTANELLAVAARSSEFDAANQLLNRGSKLADIVLATPVFQWPESGPML